MKIYNINFKNPLFLAPMSGYTNWPMRIICREFGAELAYTEMISATGLVRNTSNTLKLLERPEKDRPLIAQIFASQPHDAALASRILEDEGFDGIDLNMGCPVKKVVVKGAGAALMKDPDRALSMTEAIISAVSLPVSVKMRAGWDSLSVNAAILAENLIKAGIDTIILHPRTRSDMYRGRPRWELVADIKQITSLPVVASGDIKTKKDIDNLKKMGADACMIGRAAVGRPWIFKELSEGFFPTPKQREEVMLKHLDFLCSYLGSYKALLYMRKFVSSYVKGLPGAARFRRQACSIESLAELTLKIKAYLDEEEGFM